MDTNHQEQEELIVPLAEHLAITLPILLEHILNGETNYAKLSFMVSTQCRIIADNGIVTGSYEKLCEYKIPEVRTLQNACICGTLHELSPAPKLSYHCHMCKGAYYNHLLSAYPTGLINLLELTIFHLRINHAPDSNRLLSIHISQLEYILIQYINKKLGVYNYEH